MKRLRHSADEKCSQWVAELYRELLPDVRGAYVNWTDADIGSRPHILYRNAFPRLVEVKHRYDPSNVFASPHGIPGSISGTDAKRLELPDAMVTELHARGRLDV